MGPTAVQTEEEPNEIVIEGVPNLIEPPFGTLEWILYWGEHEGHLPSPIDVSITGSIAYRCPPLEWYNFDVYPHKIKITNTGYTLLCGAKWMAERPFLLGGPFFDKLIFSQIHFHWGGNMMEGSDHTVDRRKHPGEMQATFFKADYMTQEEAVLHNDGVVMICYVIKYGVNPDPRLQRILDAVPRIKEAKRHTRIGPYPLSQLMPMFSEDYFLYWGTVTGPHGDTALRCIVPRITLFASDAQMKTFRKLWNPWDEPLKSNFRPLQGRHKRHVFYINPHWNEYNSLLPIPRVAEESISILSQSYLHSPWLLPSQNADLIPKPPEEPNPESN